MVIKNSIQVVLLALMVAPGLSFGVGYDQLANRARFLLQEVRELYPQGVPLLDIGLSAHNVEGFLDLENEKNRSQDRLTAFEKAIDELEGELKKEKKALEEEAVVSQSAILFASVAGYVEVIMFGVILTAALPFQAISDFYHERLQQGAAGEALEKAEELPEGDV